MQTATGCCSTGAAAGLNVLPTQLPQIGFFCLLRFNSFTLLFDQIDFMPVISLHIQER